MPGAIARVGDLVRALAAELFRTRCLVCGQRGPEAVCAGCAHFPGHPGHNPLHRCALQYRDPARTVLHAIKFQKRRELLDVFRFVVETEEWEWGEDRPWVVPVPTDWRSYFERGFSVPEILAGWVAQAGHWDLRADALRKVRRTLPQHLLPEDRRRDNLQGAFEWKGRDVPRSVLLIDDVRTTGNTLAAAAEACRRVGVKWIGSWTLMGA